MASFPVPVEYKIVRNVQSVRTYVTELAQSNTPNGILCYLFNKMDIIVHDTLVKLCADHFNANDTDTAKQQLYECDEVRKLGLRQGRRRQGPNRAKNNIEDVLFALHKSPGDYRYLRCLTCQPCHNLISTTLILGSYYRNFVQCGPKLQSYTVTSIWRAVFTFIH